MRVGWVVFKMSKKNVFWNLQDLYTARMVPETRLLITQKLLNLLHFFATNSYLSTYFLKLRITEHEQKSVDWDIYVCSGMSPEPKIKIFTDSKKRSVLKMCKLQSVEGLIIISKIWLVENSMLISYHFSKFDFFKKHIRGNVSNSY